MDRDRLKEVHKTETTESRINEDFVDWLKNKGPTWLLVVLVALTVYLLFVRWQNSAQTHQRQAWIALAEAEQSAFPASLESVAEEYPKQDAIAAIARIHAGQLLLESVITGQVPGAIEGEEAPEMTEEDRELNLNRADRQFQAVLEADDGSRGMTIHAVNALNGRAAVAEARGELEAAQQHYLAAADRAEAFYPHLAEQARNRAETDLQVGLTLPSNDEVLQPAQLPGDEELRPARLEPGLRDLLIPAP